MAIKNWTIREPDEGTVLRLKNDTSLKFSGNEGVSTVMLKILISRGFDTAEKIRAFLTRQETLSDPLALRDMEKAVPRIRRALEDGERIAVYGDYDCDGIMSTVMMYRYFESAGADICYYIPQRDSEGYGLNTGALDKIHQAGVSLVITVDNGVTALAEVEYAREIGLDVIITDHHKPREVLPNALAVVDPHRVDDESGCEYLCGAGVAFKLICALEGDGDIVLDQYGDLLAVATMADIVPLVQENREIVCRGLDILQNTQNEGLAALIRVCGLDNRVLTSENVVFGLAPRINSAGRFDRVDSAIELFVTEGEDLDPMALEINQLNEQRRKIEDKIVTQILENLEKNRLLLGQRVIVIQGENWHHGVVGIVASRMVERFGKPCIVLSKDGENARGSGRSVEGFSIIDAISACSDLLLRYGGHNQAAGMTLSLEKVEAFTEAINAWAREHHPEMPQPPLRLDCTLSAKQLTAEEIGPVSCLEPFGAGNDAPLYYIPDCALQGIYPIGDGKHLRLRFCDSSKDGGVFYAIYFGMTLQAFPFSVGEKLDLAASVDLGEWNGELRVSVKIRDLRLGSIDYSLLHHSEQVYQRLMRGEALPEEEQNASVPSREDIAALYRYLRACKTVTLTDELLFARLYPKISCLCKLKIAADVLTEMNLISRETVSGQNSMTVLESPAKVDLSNSKILQSLQRCEKISAIS